MSNRDRLEDWAKGLTKKQLQKALVDVVENAIITEDINFYNRSLAPYWDSNGEPIVEGQTIWKDEE